MMVKVFLKAKEAGHLKLLITAEPINDLVKFDSVKL